MLYYLICTRRLDENGRSQRVYGVAGKGIRFEDLTTHRSRAVAFVRQLNRYQPEMCHLANLVEDFVAGATQG